MSDLAEVFRRQAVHFEVQGSPVYARLAEHLARDLEPALRVLDGDANWDVPLRLFGAVHYLVLSGTEPEALSGRWADFTRALARHEGLVHHRIATQRVQTNEVQRCIALIPAFLTVAVESGLPLELLELGPSAGLNLLADRYQCRYVNGTFGPGDARLELVAEEGVGRVPAGLLAEALVVRRRRGIDLAPVDATTREGYLLLRSFLWPGVHDRVARLDAAVETLRALPERPELVRGDYVRLLPEVLHARPADAVTVVFDTFSTSYLAADAAGELGRTLEGAGADGRPLAWVSIRPWDTSEGPDGTGFELELRLWPGPPRLAAHVDAHGNRLDWQL